MITRSIIDPNTPDFGVINGVNQITGVVAGVDERQEYSSSCKYTYFIGQFYTTPEGNVDYDNYYLFDSYDTDWTASRLSNPLWNDITFSDVRKADIAYEGCTDKQKWNIDWVRGLAIQLGYWSLFCIDEEGYYCALISPLIEELDETYESAAIDYGIPSNVINTTYSAIIKD